MKTLKYLDKIINENIINGVISEVMSDNAEYDEIHITPKEIMMNLKDDVHDKIKNNPKDKVKILNTLLDGIKKRWSKLNKVNKNVLKVAIITLLGFYGISTLTSKKLEDKMESNVQHEPFIKPDFDRMMADKYVEPNKKEDTVIYNDINIKFKPFNQFLDTIIKLESSGRPNIINSKGYVGLFQMGASAFKDIGEYRLYKKIMRNKKRDGSYYTFNYEKLFPIEKQKELYGKYLKLIDGYFKNFRHYEGTNVTIDGEEIPLTMSAILAGSHLCGHSKMKRFIMTNDSKGIVDGNGTNITKYIKLLNGYEVQPVTGRKDELPKSAKKSGLYKIIKDKKGNIDYIKKY